MNVSERNGPQKTEARTIFVDSNAVAHYVKHGLKPSLTKLDLRSGVIFGFLLQVKNLAKRFGTDRFAFFWDNPVNFRKTIYCLYKANRSLNKTAKDQELDKAAQEQMDQLRDYVLLEIGFGNVFDANGYEADDLIAAATPICPKEEIIIVSSDTDLYQLLRNKVAIWDMRKKQTITHDSFYYEYGLYPKDWPMVKAIAGDPSDNIRGIERIGKVIALKYLKGELNSNSSYLNKIILNQELIQKNLKLIQLPYQGTPICEIVKDTLWTKDFLDVCNKYQFNSFLKNDQLDEWIRLFRMR